MLVNKIIIDKIKQLLDNANKCNLKTKHLYKKILNKLLKIQEPILSRTQVLKLPNVGDKTAELILKHVETTLTQKIDNLADLKKYELMIGTEKYNEMSESLKAKQKLENYDLWNELSTEGYVDDDNNSLDTVESDITMMSISINNVNLVDKTLPADTIEKPTCLPKPIKTTNLVRKYIPGYKTGAYAILKALWIENGISKHKIIHIAKNYCNTEFDLTSRNSDWSGIKTLITKNLVYKETSSNRFFMTSEGQNVANKLFANTSILETSETNLVLLIDSREIKNKKYRSFFQNYFENSNISHATRFLDVGDFAWIKNEMVCDYIVERKCGSDFVSSIVDGRFKEQKHRLGSVGICNIFYIVENLKLSDLKKLSPELIYYSLTSTKLDKITVIETKDINETALVITKIHNNISEINTDTNCKLSYGSFIEKGNKNKSLSTKQMLFYAFSAIFGINKEKAVKLTNHFKTLKNFYNLAKKQVHTELMCKSFNLTKKNTDDILSFMYSSKDI